jgi:hypothetical protein
MTERQNDFLAESQQLIADLRVRGVDVDSSFAETLAAYRRWEAYGAPGSCPTENDSLEDSLRKGLQKLEENGKEFLQKIVNMRVKSNQ